MKDEQLGKILAGFPTAPTAKKDEWDSITRKIREGTPTIKSVRWTWIPLIPLAATFLGVLFNQPKTMYDPDVIEFMLEVNDYTSQEEILLADFFNE